MVYQFVGPSTVRMVLGETLVSCLSSGLHLEEYVKFVELDHAGYTSVDANAIRICRNVAALRPVMEWFARNGWYLYKSTHYSSTMVRADVIPSLWHKVTEGSYSVNSDGLIYTLDTANIVSAPSALVVVFSSMSLPFDGSGLSRYFQQNFASIGKHLGSNVAVLRIADLDGVVGGFYSPTSFDPDRPHKIQSLIRSCADRLGVESHRVVLYGASKGGTGALLHGLLSDSGWACIAVDPVVDDSYYESRYGDSHWTGGSVFVSRKVELFEQSLGSSIVSAPEARICIVSSSRSPLFRSIDLLVEKMDGLGVVFCRSKNPKIHDHPDVSVQTLRQVTGLLNTMSSGIGVRAGSYSID